MSVQCAVCTKAKEHLCTFLLFAHAPHWLVTAPRYSVQDAEYIAQPQTCFQDSSNLLTPMGYFGVSICIQLPSEGVYSTQIAKLTALYNVHGNTTVQSTNMRITLVCLRAG